jgi:glycosyltransferase involved in cell wall biosynthesis
MIPLKLYPPISVVMPVYNGEKYLDEAILSILNQTFPDFEFIIIDDGSSDRTLNIIHQFSDRRIFIKKNATNLGDCCCRNIGLQIAHGKYICVMDSDDLSEPERLQKQFQFMQNNPETGICGSYVNNMPQNVLTTFPTDYDQLKVEFLSNNFCVHPSIIIRKEFIEKYNLQYNVHCRYAGDYEFCARGLRYFKVRNIPEVLLQYRRHPGQTSVTKIIEQTRNADSVRLAQLTDVLGFRLEEIPVLLHLDLMKRKPVKMNNKFKAEQWIQSILVKNRKVSFYDQSILHQFLSDCLIPG